MHSNQWIYVLTVKLNLIGRNLKATYTVKNDFWKTNDHPNPAGFVSRHSGMRISLLGWIKIHPWPDSYPALAGFSFRFVTDNINTIIKSRNIYIVGHFPPHSTRAWIFIQPSTDINLSDKYPSYDG